jgi:hypothetical protein
VCPNLPLGCGSLVAGAGSRQDAILLVLAKMFKSIGCAVEIDLQDNPAVFPPGGQKLDLLVYGAGQYSRPLAIEVRVTYLLQRDRTADTMRSNEKEKNGMYK